MATVRQSRSFQDAVNRAATIKGVPVKGEKIPVQDKVSHLRLTIEQFYALIKKCKPAPSQRQHEFRWLTGKAKYLLSFELPQVEFSIVVMKGAYYLANGNTRQFAWFSDDALPKPSHVDVMFYHVEDTDHMRKVYDCYDSTGAGKRMAHELLGFMREEGVNIEQQLSSSLILSGRWKGALTTVMKVAGMDCGKVGLKQGVKYYLSSIVAVDSFGLNEKSVRHMAIIAAAIQLLQQGHSVELVNSYVNEFKRLKAGDTFGMPACIPELELDAIKAFQKKQGKSTSSEHAIPAMFPVYLRGFVIYCSTVKSSGTPALIKLATAALKKKAA